MWEFWRSSRNGSRTHLAEEGDGVQPHPAMGSSPSPSAVPARLRTVQSVEEGSVGPLSAQSAKSLSQPSPALSRLLSRVLSLSVNFRDVNFVTKGAESVDVLAEACETEQGTFDFSQLNTGVQKNRLIIIMVGLPGRGKTFCCNKLLCYLNWLGHSTRHFNVGQYRRKQKHEGEMQDATFFDHHNEAGMAARQQALQAALDDMAGWLQSDAGQVAIFDATNTTHARRSFLRDQFHGKWSYLFIETITNDIETLEQNYMNKMKYSPDYKGVTTEQALKDFKARIAKYEDIYEPIEDRSMHYIKLIDMLTGRGWMDINRISGYLPGKIVFFLMQVCRSGLGNPRKIWLTRHGQSQYNEKELLGGDSSLSSKGEAYAKLLPAVLISRLPQIPGALQDSVSVSVWTSTLKRTIQTARGIPFPKLRWKALDEIDAGTCDGLTYEGIREKFPAEYAARKKDKLRYRYPSGESYLDVIQRVEPVIIEMERERECIVIVAHQAIIRALYGYFMAIPQDKIPSVEVPLHTLIELTPLPDGSMGEVRIPIDINASMSPGIELALQPSAANSMSSFTGGSQCRAEAHTSTGGMSTLTCAASEDDTGSERLGASSGGGALQGLAGATAAHAQQQATLV